MNTCPCGSEKDYNLCCGRFLEKNEFAQYPEELMRSRYVAFAKGNTDYLLNTVSGNAATHFNAEAARSFANEVTWLGLSIINSSAINNNRGYVEFKAKYKANNKEFLIHEISEFQYIKDRWYYVDGRAPNTPIRTNKIGRNNDCPCGSGKKYKKCCLQK